MNAWIALIIGMILGWGIELLIDFFYWRKRRLCPEDEALAIKAELEKMRAANAELRSSLTAREARIETIMQDLDRRNGELVEIRSDLDGKVDEIAALQAQLEASQSEGQTIQAELANLNASFKTQESELGDVRTSLTTNRKELAEIRSQLNASQLEKQTVESKVEGLDRDLHARGVELTNLQAILATKDSEADKLNTQLDEKSSDFAALENRNRALQASLAAKESELGQLNSELGNLDGEAKKLGLGSLFAGGGLAVGGFLGSLKSKFDGNDDAAEKEAELTALRAQLADMEANRAVALSAHQDNDAEIEALKARLAICNASLMEMHTNVESGSSSASGLSMVWGLNSHASDQLAEKGIFTYTQLHNSTVDQIGETASLGAAYYPDSDNESIATSWIEQAGIAANGDWGALAGYQQQYGPAAMGDDLTKLWGVGPKIKEVLNDNGIYLFSQIASIPSYRITQILQAAGGRFRMSGEKLHESWPEQARLADRAEWDAFQTLTDKLSWSNIHD